MDRKLGSKSSLKITRLLFFVAAFPVHLWSIISQFWQYGDGKEFLERGAYSLTFALIESLVIFLVLLFFRYIFSKKWDDNKVLAILSAAYFVVAFWGMVGQIYFMLDLSEGTFLYRAFGYVGRHQTPFLIAFLLGISVSVLLPLWFAFRSRKFSNMMVMLVERISMLTILYLILDFVGVIAVLVFSL